MALFGEAALIARLENEVAYLRAQIEAGRQREEALRGELIALADARAKADIERYKVPQPGAPPFDVSGRGHREVGGMPPWLNALSGDDHIDEDPSLEVRHRDELQNEGADAEAALTEG